MNIWKCNITAHVFGHLIPSIAGAGSEYYDTTILDIIMNY